MEMQEIGRRHRKGNAAADDEEDKESDEFDVDIEPDKRYLINTSLFSKREPVEQQQSSNRVNCGTYTDYEEILREVGFGLAQILVLLGVGLVVASDAVEVLGISFIVQYIRLPSEFDLKSWEVGLLSSNTFVGMIVGGYIWGGLADINGRRTVLILSLFFNSFFAFVSSLSPNFYSLLIFRFLSGVGVGGSIPIIPPYLSEFVASKYRGPYMASYATSWITGAVLCSGVAWAFLPQQDIGINIGSIPIHSWRVFLFMCGLPSFISGILCIFMPESPRYLIEVRKEVKALKILKKMFRLNHLRKNVSFPVKSIKLYTSMQSDSEPSVKAIVCNCHKNFIEILRRTSRLYRRKLARTTILLMIVYFCLSFGTYGVTLWFPSYVDQLAKNGDTSFTLKGCNKSLVDSKVYDYSSSSVITSSEFFYCCPLTNYTNVTLDLSSVEKWWAWNSSLDNSTISNGVYKFVRLEDISWFDVTIKNVLFENLMLINSSWSNIQLINVTIQDLLLCDTVFNSITLNHVNGFSNLSNNSCGDIPPVIVPSCVQSETHGVDYNKEYFHDLIITLSGFPGNLVSAIAVNYCIHSFWLAFSLGVSALSVFLLYIVHDEVGAVVILCVFKAITIPAWSSTSLVVATVFPTSLRSTALSVFILLARIGAIVGSYIFGLFTSTTHVTLPVLLTAGLLFISTVVSVFLPRTTKQTALK